MPNRPISVISPQVIRLRILVLVTLAIIPVLLLVSYFNILQLRRSEELEVNQLKSTALLIAAEHKQVIEGARQLLVTLSASPQITNPGNGCQYYLQTILKKYQRYNNLALANKDGLVICNAAAPPLQEQISVSDRYFFTNAVGTNNFSIGEYSVSRTTGKPILTFGYPVSDDSAKLGGVVYSSLDLSWLENTVSTLSPEGGSVLLILDRNNTILATNNTHYKTGTTFSSENTDLQNKNPYLYANQQVDPDDPNTFVVVGLPKSVIYEKPNRDFQTSILLSFLVSICSVLLGLKIGNSLITKLVVATERVEELKRDFVSLVSHQLRTPLTSIKWLLQILLSKSPGALTSKQKSLLADTLYSTEQMTNLVGILLSISRLEERRVALNYQTIKIVPLIRSCQKQVKEVFDKEKIAFSLHTKINENFTTNLDTKLARQAILNLIHNAYKYSPKKSIVEVFVSKKQECLLVEIKDKGIGIPVSDHNLIFQKFTRGSNAYSKDSEGAGLGLYLTKLIIEAHKGKVWFKSTSKSTSFFFTIPLDLAKLQL